MTFSETKAGLCSKKRKVIQSDVVCLPRLHMMDPSFPGNGWTPASPWGVDESLVLLYLLLHVLLYLLDCLYLNALCFPTFTLLILSSFHWRRVSSGWAAGWDKNMTIRQTRMKGEGLYIICPRIWIVSMWRSIYITNALYWFWLWITLPFMR